MQSPSWQVCRSFPFKKLLSAWRKTLVKINPGTKTNFNGNIAGKENPKVPPQDATNDHQDQFLIDCTVAKQTDSKYKPMHSELGFWKRQ